MSERTPHDRAVDALVNLLPKLDLMTPPTGLEDAPTKAVFTEAILRMYQAPRGAVSAFLKHPEISEHIDEIVRSMRDIPAPTPAAP